MSNARQYQDDFLRTLEPRNKQNRQLKWCLFGLMVGCIVTTFVVAIIHKNWEVTVPTAGVSSLLLAITMYLYNKKEDLPHLQFMKDSQKTEMEKEVKLAELEVKQAEAEALRLAAIDEKRIASLEKRIADLEKSASTKKVGGE